MNEESPDPRPLEHVDTSDLVHELQRRSRVFFLALRPLADDPDFTAMYSISVDGKLCTTTGDERDRCYGLAQSATWETLKEVHRIAEN